MVHNYFSSTEVYNRTNELKLLALKLYARFVVSEDEDVERSKDKKIGHVLLLVWIQD